MDEPLSNLDAKLRAQTRIELVELHKRVGTTVVYVTHDQVEAMTMATRVAIMSMGQLQQVGTPQEVYERPINTFVAQFIGTPPMNCVRGQVSADGARVDVVGGSLPVPSGLSAAPSPGAEVIVGVRPEHLEGVDAVVHCAAFVEEWGTRAQFWEANVEGTTQLLSAARDAGVKRFVHIGTEAALFAGGDLVDVDETHPLPAKQRYLYSETKAEAEKGEEETKAEAKS